MSMGYVLSEHSLIYKTIYELRVADDSNFLQRAAIKAAELCVRGYVTYTHSGSKASGELEGHLASLKQMMDWLAKETPKGEKPRFAKCQQQPKPKYVDFFYC